MRFLVLLAVIGMVGCAFGQQGGGTGTVTSTNMDSDQDCITTQTPVMMGRLLMSMPRTDCKPRRHVDVVIIASDQKPAPKKPASHAKPVIKKCSGLTGECAVEGTEPAGRKSAKPVPIQAGLIPSSQASFEDCRVIGFHTTTCDVPHDTSSAIDVPAIQEDYVSAKKGGICPTMNGMICYYNEDQHDKRWTCADKERILEHSESGKYYCRRVEP